MPPTNLAQAILAFDAKMKSDNPGELNDALVEFANLVRHVNRMTLPGDDGDEAKQKLLQQLHSLLESAFPDRDDAMYSIVV